MDRSNKLECLFLRGLPFQANLMFVSKAAAYPSEAFFRCSAVTNIRLGWKSLPGTNPIAYWAHLNITNKIKSCEYGTRSRIHNHNTSIS